MDVARPTNGRVVPGKFQVAIGRNGAHWGFNAVVHRGDDVVDDGTF
jgi:hypothetical protein